MEGNEPVGKRRKVPVWARAVLASVVGVAVAGGVLSLIPAGQDHRTAAVSASSSTSATEAVPSADSTAEPPASQSATPAPSEPAPAAPGASSGASAPAAAQQGQDFGAGGGAQAAAQAQTPAAAPVQGPAGDGSAAGPAAPAQAGPAPAAPAPAPAAPAPAAPVPAPPAPAPAPAPAGPVYIDASGYNRTYAQTLGTINAARMTLGAPGFVPVSAGCVRVGTAYGSSLDGGQGGIQHANVVGMQIGAARIAASYTPDAQWPLSLGTLTVYSCP